MQQLKQQQPAEKKLVWAAAAMYVLSPLDVDADTTKTTAAHGQSSVSKYVRSIHRSGDETEKIKKKTRWDVLDVVHHEGPAAGKASSICLFTQSRTREFLIWTEWQWQPSQVTTTTTQKIKKKTIQIFWCSRVFFSYNIYTHFDTLQEPRDGWGKFIHQKNDGAWWWWWWWQFLFSILVSLLFLFLVKFWLRDKHHSWVAQKFIYKNLFPIWCRREGEKKRDVIRRPDSLFNWSSDLFVSFGVYLHKRIIGTDWPATENWPRWITKRKPDNIRSSIDRDKQRGRWPQTPKKKEER